MFQLVKGPYTLQRFSPRFFKKKLLGKSLFIYKTVEKIVAVVKKSCVVSWTITTFFAVSVVVCKGLKHVMRLSCQFLVILQIDRYTPYHQVNNCRFVILSGTSICAFQKNC